MMDYTVYTMMDYTVYTMGEPAWYRQLRGRGNTIINKKGSSKTVTGKYKIKNVVKRGE